MNTLELINSIEAGKSRASEAAFEAIVMERILEAIEKRKMELSNSIFNHVAESEKE